MGRHRRVTTVTALALLSLTGSTGALAKPKETAQTQQAGGVIRTVAGSNTRGYAGDGGSATSAAFDQPRAAAVGPDGSVYIADTFNHRVRRVDPRGAVTTLAGTGQAAYSGDGGPAGAATLHWPHGVAVDPSGAGLYIADSANHRIRRVDLGSGVITTVAGGAAAGWAGDGGPAIAAQLEDPKAVWAAQSGEVFIADSGNERIRRIDRSGTISTIAGTGVPGYSGDGGPASAAQFDGPRGVSGDSAGNLYVADDNNHRIRRIDPAGVVTTLAGTGAPGYAGDGGPARSAQLRNPRGVAVDGRGNVFIADSMNARIRMVDSAGAISTVAGCGRHGFGGDGGPATVARMFEPRGVAVGPAGHLFVADTYNDRIRRVEDPRPGAPSSKCRN
ncbi:MAG TPA: NHL repeat-containing protein [Acidimicrobiia bacterium]|nr:NHL repeat-containing protein [Acidimicrobiia bacterium]